MQQSHDAGGFTLIEVLVALAILAITVGFAFRAFTGAMASLSNSGNEQTALVLAQSILDRAGRDMDLRQGTTDGQTTDGFSWQLRMKPTGLAPAGAPLQGLIVDVTVGWRDQLRSRQVHLSSLRLATRAAN